jgi:hypothetical protein
VLLDPQHVEANVIDVDLVPEARAGAVGCAVSLAVQ